MSLNPHHYTTQPRHGLGAPGAGDFDRPSYLGASPGDFGAAPGDYGFAPLLGIPLWVWLTGAVGSAAVGTAALSTGTYLYGKGAGSADAAALAAAAQAGGAPPAYTPAAPPPGYTYPPGTTYYPPAASAPGAAPPPASTALTDQPWFWPALIATAGVLAFAAFRPRS